MNNQNNLLKAIPVLPVLNIAESVEFYKKKLGFTASTYGDYGVLSRDNIEIHLWLAKDKYLCENSSCYVRVSNIDDLYQEFKAQNVIHPNGALEEKTWGIKEFLILDIDGNAIRFGQNLE